MQHTHRGDRSTHTARSPDGVQLRGHQQHVSGVDAGVREQAVEALYVRNLCEAAQERRARRFGLLQRATQFHAGIHRERAQVTQLLCPPRLLTETLYLMAMPASVSLLETCACTCTRGRACMTERVGILVSAERTVRSAEANTRSTACRSHSSTAPCDG